MSGGFFTGYSGYANKPGKGVSKDEPEKRSFFVFFDIFFRKLWYFVCANVEYSIFSAPAIVIYFFISTFIMALAFGGSITEQESMWAVTAFLILFFFCFIGSGPATAGVTNILCNYAKERHSFTWLDFFDTFRHKFFKSLLYFIAELLAIALFTFSFSFYFGGNNTVLPEVIHYACSIICIIMAVFFLSMNMFSYPLIARTNLSLIEIYKRSALLTIAKLPQCIGILILCFAVFLVFYMAAVFLWIFFAILFFFIVSIFIRFIMTFFAVRVIDSTFGLDQQTAENAGENE